MLFMVIEKFRNQNADVAYRRFREKGRMIPDGVTFHNSWVTADLGRRCFQMMECDNVAMLQRWVAQWSDLSRSSPSSTARKPPKRWRLKYRNLHLGLGGFDIRSIQN